jgi:hypothetical protein
MRMVLAAPQLRVLAWGMHPRITKAAVVVLFGLQKKEPSDAIV